MSRRRAIAYWCVLGGTFALVALIGWLAAPEGDDWQALAWLHRNGAGPGAIARYAIPHHTIGDVAELLLLGHGWLDQVLTPLVVCLFLVGLVALATGRVPRPADPDGWLFLLLASAFVWIGAPRTGLDFFYRAYVALFVYGLTAVLWFLFLYTRCADRPAGRWRAIGAFALGLAAATANHYLAPIVLIAAWKTIRAARRRGPVPRWMWSGAAAAVIGAALMFTSKPYVPWKAIVKGGFEHNLYRLYLFMGECGELISLVMVIFFVLAMRAVLRPSSAAPKWPGPREVGIAGYAYGGALIAAFASVLTPRWGEPAMLAPVAGLTVGSLALLEGPLADRALRRVMLALGVIVHGLVIAYAVPHFARVHADWTARQDQLAAAPRGGVAHIAPYRKTVEGSWSIGDDLGNAHVRALAADANDLKAIEYTAPIGNLEGSSSFTFDEVWPDGTRTRLLTPDLDVARDRFEDDVRDGWRADWHGEARLEVASGLDWPDRRGRPLYAERAPDGDPFLPDYGSRGDKRGRLAFGIDPDSFDGVYPWGTIVADGAAVQGGWDNDEYWVVPDHDGRYTQVQCNYDACWVVQSKYALLLNLN